MEWCMINEWVKVQINRLLLLHCTWGRDGNRWDVVWCDILKVIDGWQDCLKDAKAKVFEPRGISLFSSLNCHKMGSDFHLGHSNRQI